MPDPRAAASAPIDLLLPLRCLPVLLERSSFSRRSRSRSIASISPNSIARNDASPSRLRSSALAASASAPSLFTRPVLLTSSSSILSRDRSPHSHGLAASLHLARPLQRRFSLILKLLSAPLIRSLFLHASSHSLVADISAICVREAWSPLRRRPLAVARLEVREWRETQHNKKSYKI